MLNSSVIQEVEVTGLSKISRNLDIEMRSLLRTLQSINARKSRSAWGRAVNEYAHELAESIEDGKEFKDINSFVIALLNGADDWYEYSEGGCSLISDYEIAERLCTPSEFKKKKYGELPPYRGMSWNNLS